MKQLRAPNVVPKLIAFNGGLDIVTPMLQLPPGFVRDSLNYEQDINGGYQSVTGYERYDGRAAPSAATYSILTVTLSATVNSGDVVTGASSGAFGTVVAQETGKLVLTIVSGVFGSESIEVSAVPVGTCVGPALVDSGSTALLRAQYTNLAADAYRALIGTVGGASCSGGVLGVWLYNDILYGFRNNSAGTAALMYKKSASGWVAVSLGYEVYFTNANTSVGDGDTLTQGGVTATINRVVLQTGSLASGVNTGKCVIGAPAGGNFAAGAATSTGGGTLTLSGAQAAITFAVPSGRFEFFNYNFGGGDTLRMYGCDGKNRMFEFDGTTFVPIDTGMAASGRTDAPKFIIGHRSHLFCAIGNSVQHSRPGYPYQWNVILGAGELAMGDLVTGFQGQPGDAAGPALTIFSRNHTSTLYGSSVLNWQLVPFRFETGAISYTCQFTSYAMYLDDRGLVSLPTAQTYGNFEDATISKRVQTWLKTRQNTAIASGLVRNKNQYRLLFSTGYALYVTMDNDKVSGMMPVLFPVSPTCMCHSEFSDGSEGVFFGAADGYIYQMEKGTSFDGADIEGWISLTYDNLRTPTLLKSFRHVLFEVSGSGYAQFEFSYSLGYGSSNIAQPGSQAIDASLSPSYWDSFTWDAFIWDGAALLPARGDIGGDAENISLMMRTKSDYFAPIRFSGALIQYTPRRSIR